MYDYSGLSYGPIILGSLIVLAVAVGLFLLFRGVILWYYRVNEIVRLQTRTVEVLEKIWYGLVVDKPKDSAPPREVNTWVCLKCGNVNNWTQESCRMCGTSKSKNATKL